MVAGIEKGSVDLDGDQQLLYYAIIGFLSINIPRKEKDYEEILQNIQEK